MQVQILDKHAARTRARARAAAAAAAAARRGCLRVEERRRVRGAAASKEIAERLLGEVWRLDERRRVHHGLRGANGGGRGSHARGAGVGTTAALRCALGFCGAERVLQHGAQGSTCPVSTGGGTKRVRSVREEGRNVSG